MHSAQQNCLDHTTALHLFSVHKHTLSPLSGLFNSVFNSLKNPMVYLYRTTAGFYNILVEQYFLLSFCEKVGMLGDLCYFINTNTTFIFHVTRLICQSFVSLAHSSEESNVPSIASGCLRCTRPEKTGIHLQLGLQESGARLKHTSLDL